MRQDDAYTSFASVYDSFMGDAPYEEWAEVICGLLRSHGIENGLVLELCCGTGAFTELLSNAGYDMIGVDSSQEMLGEAVKKRGESGSDILYLQQDVREFELYGTVRAAVCVCDSLNYIPDEAGLREVFRLVNNYLDPGGIFVFDLKTAYYLGEIMGDSVTAQHRPEGSLIWENNYYSREKMNEYDLTFFLRRKDGLYERRSETHRIFAYGEKTVKRLLEEAGLLVEAVLDADTLEKPDKKSGRLYFVAREQGKENVPVKRKE